MVVVKVKVKAPFDLVTSKTSTTLDQGWSWVIMMACFGAMFIVIGYQRSFGLLFVAFQERCDYSSVLMSAINGTQSLTYSFSTMVVMNFVLKKISIRTSCLIGVCFQTVGIIASSQYSDAINLIMFQGFMFGLGHSFLFCPTILILSQYFERHRSLATAVATSGSSIGGIAFPYISQYLLNTLGLNGALLVLGGFIFNQSVFFALYRPVMVVSEDDDDDDNTNTKAPPGPQIQDEHQKFSDNTTLNANKINTTNSNGIIIACDTKNHPNLPNFIIDKNHDDKTRLDSFFHNVRPQINVTSDQNNTAVGDKNCNCVVQNPHHSPDTKTHTHPCKVAQLASSQTIYSGVPSHSELKFKGKGRLYASHGVLPSQNDITVKPQLKYNSDVLNILGRSCVALDHIHSSLPALIIPVFFHERSGKSTHQGLSSQHNVSDENEDECVTSHLMSGAPCDTSTSVAMMMAEDVDKSEDRSKKCNWVPRVMRMPKFWLVGLYMIGGIISAGCPAIYIPPLSLEKGLSNDDATFFLTISSVTDLLGRIGSGVILHFKVINPCNLALIPLTVLALLFNMTVLLRSFGSIMFLTLMYGLGSGMFWTLSTLVMIDVLGLQNLGPAMGFYAVVYGLTTSASFPFAGWLHDETGSYSSSFSYFGAMSLLAALALLLVMLPRYRSKSASCLSGVSLS